MVGALNRAQQAYYLEKDRFTTNLDSIGVVKPNTANYRYRLFIAPDRYLAAMQVALPKSPALSTFIGFSVSRQNSPQRIYSDRKPLH